MRALKQTIMSVFVLCIAIVGVKMVFRIFNVSIMNMMVYWITMVVTFAIISFILNLVLIDNYKKRKLE